jgi:hypothetical protein
MFVGWDARNVSFVQGANFDRQSTLFAGAYNYGYGLADRAFRCDFEQLMFVAQRAGCRTLSPHFVPAGLSLSTSGTSTPVGFDRSNDLARSGAEPEYLPRAIHR